MQGIRVQVVGQGQAHWRMHEEDVLPLLLPVGDDATTGKARGSVTGRA